MPMRTYIVTLGVAATLAALGCAKPADNAPIADNTTPPATTPVATEPVATPPTTEMTPTDYIQACKDRKIDRTKLPHVAMEVKGKGTIVLEFAPELATLTCKQILAFIEGTFPTQSGEQPLGKLYEGQRIHRVEDWVVQWGDPQSKSADWKSRRLGAGSTGNDLPFESNEISMKRGVLAMASTGAKIGGDCQMFILKKDSEFLNGDYTAFGYVTSGMEIVDKLAIGDQITMKRKP